MSFALYAPYKRGQKVRMQILYVLMLTHNLFEEQICCQIDCIILIFSVSSVKIHYILLAFPAEIGRKPALPARAWEPATRTRRREPASPVTRTRRLIKRPTAQHGGARVERDRCVTISLNLEFNVRCRTYYSATENVFCFGCTARRYYVTTQ